LCRLHDSSFHCFGSFVDREAFLTSKTKLHLILSRDCEGGKFMESLARSIDLSGEK
jgi:hypothetical protein